MVCTRSWGSVAALNLNSEGERSALIVVDAQQGFTDPSWGERNNVECEARMSQLLVTWRRAGWPIVLVRHDSVSPSSPLRPGQPGNEFMPWVDGPHDLLVKKTVNSAFYGQPDLDSWLRGSGIGAVTICGITTNHCCETTARMAGNLGYDVTFVIDATFTFDRVGPDGVVLSADELARATAVNLAGEFAQVVTTESVLTEFADR
jgi:nicotinamidase-related amidase